MPNTVDARTLKWQSRGLCVGKDPLLWYPEIGDRAARSQIDRAITICQHCPVQRTCLEYAMTRNEKFGVWGGLTATERRTLRQRRAQLRKVFNTAA